MRRLLAIFVLAVLGCSSVAPAALAASATATPACCRRDGKHHCQSGMADMPGMSTDGTVGDRTPKLRATVPDCPHRFPSTTPTAAGQAQTAEFSAPLPAKSSLLAQPNSGGFDSEPVLQNSERGPPSSH